MAPPDCELAGERCFGLHMGDFHWSRTVHSFAVVFATLIGFWALFFSVWRRSRSPAVRVISTLAIMGAWGWAWWRFMPRNPGWILELCATCWVINGCWHMLDYLVCRLHEDIPRHMHLGQLLLDDVLVLRPDVMVQAMQAAARKRAQDAAPARQLRGHAAAAHNGNSHAGGDPKQQQQQEQHGEEAAAASAGEVRICRGSWHHVRRPATGRGLRTRVEEALPPLGVALAQYVACEVLNAWLMQQSREDALYGPIWFRLLASFVFGTTLFFHLSYFFYSMKALNLLLRRDVVPGEWHPAFLQPWFACSPTELWNERWHMMFRFWFVRLVFRPLRTGMLEFKRWRLAHLTPHSLHAADGVHAPATGTTNGTAALGKHNNSTTGGVTQLRQRAVPAPGSKSGGAPSSYVAALWQHMSKRRRAGALQGPARPDQDQATPASSAHDHHSGTTAEHLVVEHNNGTQQHLVSNGKAHGHAGEQHHHQRLRLSSLEMMVPTMAVFMASGLFHEVMITLFWGRPTGEQFLFFVIHGLAVIVHRAWQQACQRAAKRGAAWPRPLPDWAAWPAFMLFFAPTAVLFMQPWFRNEYHKEYRVLIPSPIHYTVAEWTRSNDSAA